jgi:hypothetical protein
VNGERSVAGIVEAERPRDVRRSDHRSRSMSPPSIRTVWAAIAFGVPVAATWFGRTQAIDLAYQIRAGELMLDSHRLLTTDPFTFTVAGTNWLNQQWGAEVVFAALWRWAGWGGIAVAWGLLVGLACLFVHLACRGRGASPVVAACLTLAAYVVAAPILTMRPQLFGIVLFAATQWIVATRDRSPARLWVVPVMAALWANLHGSFVLLFALLTVAWFEERMSDRLRRRVVVVGGLSLVATLVNPFGVRVWTYVTSIAGNPTISGRVAEWGPPSVRTPIGALFIGSVLAAFVFLATRQHRVPIVTLIALCFYALLGMAAVRGVVWWALACPALVAPALRPDRARTDERSFVNAGFLIGICVLLVVAYPGARGSDPVSGGPAILTFAPEDLVEAARGAVPPGAHVFASEVYGSWFEFSAPDLPVFVDPRIELFPSDVWNDYFAVEEGRAGWEETLRRWNVDVVVLHPDWASGLLKVIPESTGWRLVTTSPDGSVYARVVPVPG